MAFLLAPFFTVIPAEHAARLNKLKAEGFATLATIKDKRKVQNYYTDSKGRTKSTTETLLDLEYDMMANMPYAKWLAEGEKDPPARSDPANMTYARVSSNAEFDGAAKGSKAVVIIHPNERGRAELASYVKSYNPMVYYVAAVIFAFISVFAGYMAWKTRVKA
jgi:hypothetical protein